MIVVDATVLVYAVGAEHSLRESCRALIGAISRGELIATTTIEVLQEFCHVRARRRGRTDAARRTGDYLDLLAPLLTIGERDLSEGLRVYERSDRLGAFDAVLAATARGVNATGLVSADVAFADADVVHVVPDADGVASLLRGDRPR